MKRFVFAISGASGSIIGIRVLRELVKSAEVYLIISSQSFSMIRKRPALTGRQDQIKLSKRICALRLVQRTFITAMN